jgi:hypothetical protein
MLSDVQKALRRTDVGMSEVEAFSVGYETGNREAIKFIVRHWRDTRSGGSKANPAGWSASPPSPYFPSRAAGGRRPFSSRSQENAHACRFPHRSQACHESWLRCLRPADTKAQGRHADAPPRGGRLRAHSP